MYNLVKQEIRRLESQRSLINELAGKEIINDGSIKILILFIH